MGAQVNKCKSAGAGEVDWARKWCGEHAGQGAFAIHPGSSFLLRHQAACLSRVRSANELMNP